MMYRRLVLAAILLASCFGLLVPSAPAYIGGPPLTLGLMCGWSTHVMIARVERTERDKNLIFFRKVRDVKGRWPADVIRHYFNPGLPNRQYVMEWCEPGKTVVMCALESYKWGHTYIDGEWYANNTTDWQLWNVSHTEPALLALYAGRVNRLVEAVGKVVAGQEVVVPVLETGPEIAKRRGRYMRIKASLKRPDLNQKRDFVGWGKDDYDSVAGMAGFSQMATLSKLGADVQSICSADFDGDGKADLCLVGGNRVSVVLNGGDYFHETALPDLVGGCRSAVAADYDGDGKPDLLLATPTGPRLFTNLGQGNFRDDTKLLPREATSTLTAAAWIDYDRDGRPDILLANGYHGLRVYRNKGMAEIEEPKQPPDKKAPAAKPKQPSHRGFEDRSDVVGLGANGHGTGIKGDSLTVFDANGDGWPDFLFAGTIYLSAPHGFMPVKDSGLDFTPGKIGPVVGDFDADGIPDLFVPQDGSCKLFRGDGKGRFRDVTPAAGDLASFTGRGTCAACGDFDNDGHLDLVVGCLRGPNRFFRNLGNGAFEDATTKIGLERRWFNTQALCLVDLNNDGKLDMVLNNEGQESVVLLGNPELASPRTPVSVSIGGVDGVIGSRVQLFKEGRLLGSQQISGGDGRHQPPPEARFVLEPGQYQVRVRFSSGVIRGREVVVGQSPVRGAINEQTPRVDN